MKKYLRAYLFNLASLWLCANALEGVSYEGGSKTLATTALVLTLINLLVKPLVNLLLLPINLITLGTFRWVINVISLYLVTLTVPLFKVNAFLFQGFEFQGFVMPAINLSIFWAFVVASFLISLTTTLLHWLAK